MDVNKSHLNRRPSIDPMAKYIRLVEASESIQVACHPAIAADDGMSNFNLLYRKVFMKVRPRYIDLLVPLANECKIT